MPRLLRALFPLAAVALLHCATPSTLPTSTTPATATPLFCAFGGVGLVPDPLPPGYEVQFATAAFDVTVPAATSGVTVTDFVLLDHHGKITAKLKRVVEVVELPTSPAPAKSAPGSFAFYLNPKGAPFPGALPAGTTRLRARVALDGAPVDVERFRVTLGGTTPPLVIEAPIDGAWGT